MSKWQLSCLEALMESPSSYKVFEKSQYNRQAVVQYRTKLFPIHIVPKSTKTKNKTSQQACFNKLKKILIQSLPSENHSDYDSFNHAEYLNELGHDRGRVVIDKISDLRELRLCPIKMKKYFHAHPVENYPNKGQYNTLCELYFNYNCESSIKPNGKSSATYSQSKSVHISRCINHIDSALFEKNSYFAITELRFCNSVTFVKERTLNLLKSIEKCLYDEAPTKSKNSKNSHILHCNFGIEIEYEGIPVPNSLKSKLLQLGAIDFHSGIDGSDCNVEDWGSQADYHRLYEVRLRIDGFKGLPALYHLVDYMLETGCHIPTTGSIHCHVDHNWDMSLYSNRYATDTLREWISEKSYTSENKHVIEEVIRSIFKFPEFRFDEIFNKNRIYKKSEFNTFEYRFLTPLLNYKSIVADIITVSHISRCFKADVPLNLALLYKIDIAKKNVLRERPIQLAIPGDGSIFIELPSSQEPQEEETVYTIRDIWNVS